jgi:hypothetical protein
MLFHVTDGEPWQRRRLLLYSLITLESGELHEDSKDNYALQPA